MTIILILKKAVRGEDQQFKTLCFEASWCSEHNTIKNCPFFFPISFAEMGQEQYVPNLPVSGEIFSDFPLSLNGEIALHLKDIEVSRGAKRIIITVKDFIVVKKGASVYGEESQAEVISLLQELHWKCWTEQL